MYGSDVPLKSMVSDPDFPGSLSVLDRLRGKRPSINWIMWHVGHKTLTTKEAAYALCPVTKFTSGYVKLIHMTDNVLKRYVACVEADAVNDIVEQNIRATLKLLWPSAT